MTRSSQPNPSPPRRGSLTTNASAIADSTISNNSFATGETLSRLPQFPSPPEDIPYTPLRADFEPSSPSESAFLLYAQVVPDENPGMVDHNTIAPSQRRRGAGDAAPPFEPLHAQRPLPSFPDGAQRVPRTVQQSVQPNSPVTPSTAHSLSPFDWHEGSSTIVVNAEEDRMLSTRLITNLLSETATSDGSTDVSNSSDSMISYPPPRNPRSSDSRGPPPIDQADPHRGGRYQPVATQPPYAPPSAYVPIQLGGRLSSIYSQPETATVHSQSASLSNTGPEITIAGRTLRADSGASHTPSSLPSYGDRHSFADSRAHLIRSHSGDGQLEDSSDEHKLDFIDANVPSSSLSYSPALPSSSARPKTRTPKEGHRSRPSVTSTKTAKSFVSSMIDRLSNSSGARSVRRPLSWMFRKPLPPVPVLPNSTIMQEMEQKRLEGNMQLSDLAVRADTLESMLKKGHRPYQSATSFSLIANDANFFRDQPQSQSAGYTALSEEVRSTGVTSQYWQPGHGKMHSRSQSVQKEYQNASSSPKRKRLPTTKKGKIKLALVASGVVALIIIGTVVGVVVGRERSGSHCSGNLAGSNCTLDATCVCVDTTEGQCIQTAQALISLLPTLNELFAVNFTTTSLATSLWEVQGAVTGSNCAKQAVLIDVAPALDTQTVPNRTTWAQSALLWNLLESQDSDAVSDLQAFVKRTGWSSISGADGPISGASSHFSYNVSGFAFNFAAQTVTPQNSASFIVDGQPSNAQVRQVNDVAKGALDRIYSFASASSAQREKALTSYWTSVLQQKEEHLPWFISAVRGSSILLPFDATLSPAGHAVTDLMTNSTGASFPPPLACYPGLNDSQLKQINAFETSVFGLDTISQAATFDNTCFPNRPIYGVLDLLNLRLPFNDSQSGVAKQAVAVSRAVSPRAVIYNGEALSALPDATVLPTFTPQTTNPREFGTIGNLNHVLLNYLTSITDTNLAMDLVEYVLASPVAPPANTTTLAQNIASIPMLEVAVFGSITTSDVSSVVSSFSTPSGSLFFGTDQSETLREWAITAVGTSVSWAELAMSSEIVKDSSLTDSTFNSVWDPAHAFFHTQDSGIFVDVGNITTAFEEVGKFTSS